MTPVEVVQGDGPIVLGLPHTGTHVPEAIWADLNDEGRKLRDTDWHVHRLYDGLLPGVTTVRATFHRYVIDANRDPSGDSLYPGQNTTGLVPMTDFDNQPIWLRPPVVADRLDWHTAYHAAMQAEMARVRAKHGVAIHCDCHSIRSLIPFLFDGRLPDFNIGDNNGATCAPEIAQITHSFCSASDFSTVLNGRFKGGWTTRHYGRPSENWHAIQMELAQSAYLETEEPPFAFSDTKAAKLRPILSQILHQLADLATTLGAAK